MRDVLLESGVTVVDPLGLHARPAAELVRSAESFRCDIWLEKDGLQVNAKSIMGVLMLAAEKGSQIVIKTKGEDAEQALKTLTDFISRGFGEIQGV
tara:strand:+ start:45 stop:332 length:288 start_codon:yes stop_codon:yes gene_type:complete